MPDNNQDKYLTRPIELSLGFLTGVLVANVYYIHPIISEVASDLGVNAATIGLVPALSQIALALGIVLLLPLGDRYSNKTLLIVFSIGQCISLLMMGFSSGFAGFLLGSTALGFFTIGPYLLPAYASKRVSPARLGAMTATLGVGSSCGILLARILAGQIAEYSDWRIIYIFAATLMVVVTCALPFILEGRSKAVNRETTGSYSALTLSVFTLMFRFPRVLVSAGIQALCFGIFLSVWLALALHLTSPEMGYGVDVVGYLAIVSLVALLSTPKAGAWADRNGAEQVRFKLTMLQLLGLVLLFFFSDSLWLLLIPIILMNAVGPALDVTGRMAVLSFAPEIRSRLMAGFFFIAFIGGGVASWATTASFELGGWNGSLAFIATLAISCVLLAKREARLARLAGAR